MLSYDLSWEQQAIRESAKNLAASLESHTERWDQEGAFEREIVAEPLRKAGLTGMTIPKEYGGTDSPYLDFIIAFEQFARISYPAAFFFASTCSGPIDFILKLASAELKHTYLPKLASGEQLCAIAISEPNAGSDLGAIATDARIEGDEVRINGTNIFVGGGGDWEVYVALVRMSDAPGVAGLGSIVIDKDAPGLKFGSKFKMMGSRPSLAAS